MLRGIATRVASDHHPSQAGTGTSARSAVRIHLAVQFNPHHVQHRSEDVPTDIGHLVLRGREHRPATLVGRSGGVDDERIRNVPHWGGAVSDLVQHELVYPNNGDASSVDDTSHIVCGRRSVAVDGISIECVGCDNSRLAEPIADALHNPME